MEFDRSLRRASRGNQSQPPPAYESIYQPPPAYQQRPGQPPVGPGRPNNVFAATPSAPPLPPGLAQEQPSMIPSPAPVAPPAAAPEIVEEDICPLSLKPRAEIKPEDLVYTVTRVDGRNRLVMMDGPSLKVYIEFERNRGAELQDPTNRQPIEGVKVAGRVLSVDDFMEQPLSELEYTPAQLGALQKKLTECLKTVLDRQPSSQRDKAQILSFLGGASGFGGACAVPWFHSLLAGALLGGVGGVLTLAGLGLAIAWRNGQRAKELQSAQKLFDCFGKVLSKEQLEAIAAGANGHSPTERKLQKYLRRVANNRAIDYPLKGFKDVMQTFMPPFAAGVAVAMVIAVIIKAMDNNDGGSSSGGYRGNSNSAIYIFNFPSDSVGLYPTSSVAFTHLQLTQLTALVTAYIAAADAENRREAAETAQQLRRRGRH